MAAHYERLLADGNKRDASVTVPAPFQAFFAQVHQNVPIQKAKIIFLSP
ncbi:hypothetical protein SynSYN20_00267 [Synechococcus sp. SYN20]|nr:hypothetical protein SynSYN20_00267 [Synechococcus sp. SYN20]